MGMIGRREEIDRYLKEMQNEGKERRLNLRCLCLLSKDSWIETERFKRNFR